jgi:DNA cross-link repair 1C protein
MAKQFEDMLRVASRSTGKALSLDDMGFDREEPEMTFEELTKNIAAAMLKKWDDAKSKNDTPATQEDALSKVITFPYSRHSSYYELCDLVGIFKPKDVYPCTVDETIWSEGIVFSVRVNEVCG